MQPSLTTAALALAALALAACTAAAPPTTGDTSYSTRGHAEAGALLFADHCAPCHATTAEERVGPGLAGLFAQGGTLPDGQPRTETNVAAWLLTGGSGPRGTMPPQELDAQQIADIIADLRTLSNSDILLKFKRNPIQ
ncbi:cytochrome c [Chloroflexia bacterium SDU3-3]|nr:cytochrome c [Chloroflexia bacterium SDU3-3]